LNYQILLSETDRHAISSNYQSEMPEVREIGVRSGGDEGWRQLVAQILL